MDLTGLSIEELQEKLAAADGYDERAAIRAELRKLKKERGVQSAKAVTRKGAPTYNRFGGSSDTSRGRAVTISITSTAKPKESRQIKTKTKDDSEVRSVTSPQSVRDADKKTTPIMSPEPATTSNDAPVKSPPSVESPSPVKSPPPPVKSPPPTSSTFDEADIGIKKSGPNKQPSSAKPSNEKAEFQGFQLRKTGLSVHDKGRSNKSKATSSSSERVSPYSTATSSTTKSYSPAGNTSKKAAQVSSEPAKQSSDVAVNQLQQYLVAFVNQALGLDPPLPSAGRPFYTTCCQPDIICSLLNHAVPGTVDMRALSPNLEPDSRESNMMLALESARAIGCHIGDDSFKSIERGEPQAIRQLVMDIVRAKVVHLPNMEDEPRETFDDPVKLFALLDISISNSGKEPTPDQFSPPPKSTPSPITSPPPAALKATSDNKRSSFDTSLSYEERAALRRAEREERRRQREALA